jgi:hypothetical protein
MNKHNVIGIVGVAVIVAAAVLAGCASQGTSPSGSATPGGSAAATPAPETNPAGDIPDTQTFVPFTLPGGLFTVSVPEGWARSTDGAATIFTDKLDTVRIESRPMATGPNTESASVDELPAVAASTPGYRLGTVTAVERKTGQVILITYQAASPPNPVTNKAGTDAVERYEYWRDGHELVLTLSGPVGADNVDAWRTITDSVR